MLVPSFFAPEMRVTTCPPTINSFQKQLSFGGAESPERQHRKAKVRSKGVRAGRAVAKALVQLLAARLKLHLMIVFGEG